MNPRTENSPGDLPTGSSKGLCAEGCVQRRRRALVVDDDPCARLYVTRVLEGLGFRVDTAECVRSATLAIAGPWFDLVVSDGHLPDGLGPMVLDRVRSRGRDGDPGVTRMFGMTASTDEALRRAFLDAGAGVVMIKPVPLMMLRAVVG